MPINESAPRGFRAALSAVAANAFTPLRICPTRCRYACGWREAVAEGQEERLKTVEAEIDSLLREKEEIEKWAAVGSP